MTFARTERFHIELAVEGSFTFSPSARHPGCKNSEAHVRKEGQRDGTLFSVGMNNGTNGLKRKPARETKTLDGRPGQEEMDATSTKPLMSPAIDDDASVRMR